MNTSELRNLTPGTVMGFLALVFSLVALVIALSGNADAARHVFVKKGDIAPGAVTAKSLARSAVHRKALAKGAVSSPKISSGAVGPAALAKGAVTASALARGSVGPSALADDSVTASAIAPKSVGAAALGEETVHTATIADNDEVASNPEWTSSDTAFAPCAPGERLIQGGGSFTNPGNREVTFLELLPVINPATNGFKGSIASNSGGSAQAQLTAYCLK